MKGKARRNVWSRIGLARHLDVVVVFVVTLLLYTGVPGVTRGVLSHPFLGWDDDIYILKNPLITTLTWQSFKAWWTHPYFVNYAPLHLASYAIDYRLWGGAVPRGFHLTDALLHAGASVFALLLFRRIAGSRVPALIAALLFALHPVQVESAAWASERKSVLAMFFLIPSFLLFLRHRDRTPEGLRSGWPTAAYLGSLACYALSLLSKGMGVVFPIVLLLYERLRDPRPRRVGRFAELAPYFLLALVLGLATLWAQKAGLPAITGWPIKWDLLCTMTVVFRDYLRTIFLPMNLNNLYYPELLPTPWRSDFLLSAGLLAGVAGITGWLVARSPKLAFWPLWFFVSLGPVSNLFFLLPVLRADRYLYLSSLAFGGLAADWVGRIAGGGETRRRAAVAAFTALILCFALLTFRRIDVWGSDEALWRDSVAKAPRSHIAHGSLGGVYMDRGDLDSALAEFREAVRLQPLYQRGYFNIGFIEARRGRMAQAAVALRRGLSLGAEPPAWNQTVRESYAFIHLYIGEQAFAEGKLAEAKEHYRRALDYRPAFPEAAFDLGVSLARQGRQREAYAAFLRAATLKPDFYEAHREAGLSALRGGASAADAEREIGAALAQRPEGPEAEALRQVLAAAGKAGGR